MDMERRFFNGSGAKKPDGHSVNAKNPIKLDLESTLDDINYEAAVIVGVMGIRNKEYRDQLLFNVKIILLLKRAQDRDVHVAAAINTLEERNAVLKFADMHPTVPDAISIKENIREIGKNNGDLAGDLHDFFFNHDRQKTQKDQHQRHRAKSFHTNSSFLQRGRSYFITAKKFRGRCYACGVLGHLSNQCPYKKWFT